MLHVLCTYAATEAAICALKDGLKPASRKTYSIVINQLIALSVDAHVIFFRTTRLAILK